MSGSISTAAESLSRLPTEQLPYMNLDFVLGIRGLQARTGGDLVEREELGLRVMNLYPPDVLLSLEVMNVPLLHQGLPSYIRRHAISMGRN